MQVLANIAKRLQSMHEAGYAHRDLKPANVMWLPRENQWTLIDFGCAAPIGQQASLSFTLTYAAPEVIAVWKSGVKTCMSTGAVDAWALGVMVYELLTGRPTFDVLMQGRDEVRRFWLYVYLLCNVVLVCPVFIVHETVSIACWVCKGPSILQRVHRRELGSIFYSCGALVVFRIVKS